MYARVILSALLFSLPFLFPAYCGFLILFFWLPLKHVFIKNVFMKGLVWGIVAYGLHFLWLLDLLIKKSHAGIVLSLCLYSIIVGYASLTSGMLFVVLSRPLGVLAAPLYFFLLDRYMFWFLGVGYSFLNPLLPLLQYKKIAIFLLSLVGLGGPKIFFMPQEREVQFRKTKFIYLAPAKNGFEIYEQLKAAKQDGIFVGPETALQIPLNKKEYFVRMWDDVVPSGAEILLGSLREERDEKRKKTKQYQTIYHLARGLIIENYDKTLRVPFAEKVPRWWRWWRRGGEFFLKNKYSISKGKGARLFCVNSLRIRPLVCSEAFDLSTREIGEGDLLIAFVNDSWFCSYFRRLMVFQATLKAWRCGKPFLYIGHPKK